MDPDLICSIENILEKPHITQHNFERVPERMDIIVCHSYPETSLSTKHLQDSSSITIGFSFFHPFTHVPIIDVS